MISAALIRKEKIKIIFILMVLFTLLSGCAEEVNQDTVSTSGEVKLMAATDLHYLSETLYDENSMIFRQLKESNDGKLFEESTAILEALKEKTIREKPDALLLSGDLTFNGELVSLKEMAKVFAEIEEAGIPVLVISGNHDICYGGAASYFGDKAEIVTQITPEMFADVMGSYGFSEALHRDPSSLSYVYELKDDLWLMVLDANMPGYTGTVLPETMTWAEPLLAEAMEKEIHVIVMSHQNFLPHNSMMYNGYVINNHEALAHMLRKYGVQLSLSGHSHMEHTAVSEGLTDICSESLAIYPLQYSVITIPGDRDGYTYEKKKLGILEQESYDRFAGTVFRMTPEIVGQATDDPSEQAVMTEYAAALNAAYFSGDYEKVRLLADDPARKLWQEKAGDSFWGYYLENIFTEIR